MKTARDFNNLFTVQMNTVNVIKIQDGVAVTCIFVREGYGTISFKPLLYAKDTIICAIPISVVSEIKFVLIAKELKLLPIKER